MILQVGDESEVVLEIGVLTQSKNLIQTDEVSQNKKIPQVEEVHCYSFTVSSPTQIVHCIKLFVIII